MLCVCLCALFFRGFRFSVVAGLLLVAVSSVGFFRGCCVARWFSASSVFLVCVRLAESVFCFCFPVASLLLVGSYR